MGREVKCEVCNTRFVKGRKVFQNTKTGRYLCNSCAKKIKYVKRLNTIGMKQSFITMFIKILFGISMFSTELFQENIALPIFGILIILWALIPFLRRKKTRQRQYYLEEGTGIIKYNGQ